MGKNNRFESRGSFRGGYGRGGFNRGSFRGRNFGGNRDGYNNYNTWNNRGNEWQQRPPRRDTPGKRLTEEEIGVTEYLSDHEGFEGIIKLRYSDFQVSEINLQGEVAELTDMTPPKPPPEEEVLEDEDLLTLKYNVEILSMDMWNRLNKLIVGGEDAEERIELDVTTSSKEERTKIHEAVKKAFGDAIVGSTVTVDDKKYVKFEKYKKGVRVDKRVKWIWPADYVYFIVHKENCDTMDAAIKIADKLRMHIKPSMLGYAGTKDRRAKTSQWFSVRRVEPARLAAAGRALPDLALGNYSFQPRVLRLGMLAGNRFRIALRNVTAPDHVIAAACDHLRTNGFINYYGLQRFGTRAEVPTFAIGRSLLQGDYKQAVHYMVGAEGGAGGGVIRGAAGAAAGALRARPNDLQTAIHKVPRNTRLLYVHSYQSLIWNRCVSERLRRHGLAPAPGDLVPETALPLVEESEDEEQENEDEKHDEKSDEKFDEKPDENFDEKPNEKFDEKPDKKPDVKPDSEPQTSEAGQSKEKNPSNKEEKQKIPVKVLTQEDIDSGKYTLFDIIMPLPGYNIDYPPNMLDYYEKLLKEDGLTTELRNKNKSYSMSGAYRPLAVVPRGVEWSRVRYDDPLADLLASDLDKLRGRQLTGIVPDGKFSALLLTITLPVSSYATMALRELLRVNTSPESQAANNQYHMKDDGPPLKKQKVDE